jgi:small subunit ribosomal protein S10
VNKKSREQFEIRTHKRLIEILEPSARTMEDLRKINMPAGVNLKMKA